MNLFRIVFLSLSFVAICVASYASYKGYGGESRDLDRSIRLGSGGGGYLNSNRVK
ncbi:hypothetical protein HGE68_02880 [Rhodobacteraceae bacterium R_SAG6]|nr:hypothetical protein [Rhodobacteraceae bacterium G21628-S1]NKX28821.1 hypothetical protein [Rhodobacteraceae bacterium R_SAG6]